MESAPRRRVGILSSLNDATYSPKSIVTTPQIIVNTNDDDTAPFLQTSTSIRTPTNGKKVSKTCCNSVIRLIVFAVGISVLAIALGKVALEQIRNGKFDPNVEAKQMVLYSAPDTLFTKAQGHFSELQATIGAVCYGIRHGAASIRVNYENAFYTDEAEGRGKNYWLYFYENDTMILDGTVKNAPEVHFNGWIGRYGKLGSFTRDVIGANRDQRRPYPLDPIYPIGYLHELVQKHVKVKKFVKDAVETFIEKQWPKDHFVLGIHFRGTDKVDAYPHKLPAYGPFEFYTQLAIEKYNTEKRPVHLHIATDSSDFIPWAQKKWHSISYLDNSPRLSDTDAIANRMGTHKNSNFSNFDKGLSAVMDMLLLSRTSYLIKNRSGLSDVAIWFAGPSLQYTLIIGEDDPVFSTDDFPQPPPQYWTY